MRRPLFNDLRDLLEICDASFYQGTVEITSCHFLPESSFIFSRFHGQEVGEGYRRTTHGCSRSQRAPIQALTSLGRNGVPELLWDVVSPRGLWNSRVPADRDWHWGVVIPSEWNLRCTSSPRSSGLDSWTLRGQPRCFRGLSEPWAPEGLEADNASEFPRFLCCLMQAYEWPWAFVRVGEERVH